MAQSVPAAATQGPVTESESDDQDVDRTPPTGVHNTDRWRGITGLTLLAIGLGLMLEEPAVLLASVFGVAFAAYGQIGDAPVPDVSVERSIGDRDPDVGDAVSVHVTVRNDGEGFLPDVRVIDGVPDGLSVGDGSPRVATALRPGEAAEIEYEVEITRGGHAFDPVVVIARDATGATERVLTVDADDRIECVPTLPVEPPSFPLRTQTTRYTGRRSADEGGTGVEFHATREYRAGDPLSRIDWKRTARTRDLTTVEYRRERAASVLLVIDARREAYAAPDPHDETAVDRSVDAARTVAGSLLADGHMVGIAALGPRDSWVAPGRGVEHKLTLRRELAVSDAFARRPPEADCNVYGAGRELRERIAGDTQVVVFSPLLDGGAADTAHRFEAHGHRTSIVAPDPSVRDTVGQHASAIARSVRVVEARHAGIPTIDWVPDESFERALLRGQRRWSA